MKFTGEQHDPTDLYHLRARQYDPAIGRFLARDPLEQPWSRVVAASPYHYVHNMPVAFIDPSGLESQSIVDRLGHTAASIFDGALQVGQLAPYAMYYVSWRALEHSEYMPFYTRATLIATQIAGLAGDTAFDIMRHKPINDDGARDSVLPEFIRARWDPPWLRTRLPGIHPNWHVDLRY